MSDSVSISNRALQRLGAKRITSLSQDTPNARSCNFCYDELRRAELRAHPWSCAIKRIQISADATDPLFGKSKRYLLPSDFIRIMPLDPAQNSLDFDYQIEGNYIYTDDASPINLRYIYDLEDVSIMDALLREAISMRMAKEMCEEITQSNTKMELVQRDYKLAVREARKTNAIESIAQEPPEDTWVTVRA